MARSIVSGCFEKPGKLFGRENVAHGLEMPTQPGAWGESWNPGIGPRSLVPDGNDRESEEVHWQCGAMIGPTLDGQGWDVLERDRPQL